jgi:hypothetical protein
MMPGEDQNTDAQSVERLQAALANERAAHKATRAQMLAPFRTALGLGDDADAAAVLSTLGTRLGETETVVAERTAALSAERDAATTRAAEIETRWNAERIDSALSAAWERSAAIPDNRADYLALARPLFTVDAATGAVVTKADTANTVPGASPEQWILGQLQALRPHWWARSVGGNSRGGGVEVDRGGGVACFDPRSPQFSVTRQFAYEATHGAAAADRARAQFARYRVGVLK